MKKSLLFIFSLILAAGLFAQEVVAEQPAGAPAEPAAPTFEEGASDSDWVVTFGISYRNFKNPELKSGASSSFEDFILNDADGMYYNAGTPASPNQDAMKAAWDARFPGVTSGVRQMTFGSFNGAQFSKNGSYGNADQIAPILGFEKGLWEKDELDVKLVGNFQFFTMDSGAKGSGAASISDRYDYWVARSAAGINYNTISKLAPSSSVAGTVPVSASVDFDMDLYVFDLGLNAGYNFDNGVRGFVAAGPTLTLADMNSSSSVTVVTGNGIGKNSDSDDDLEFNLGLYVSVGANYWLNESIGLSGELRFDRGCGDVGTRYFSQNMDTVGGILKLQYRF